MSLLSAVTGFARGEYRGYHADMLDLANRLAQMTGDDDYIYRKIEEGSAAVGRREPRPGEIKGIVAWARERQENPDTEFQARPIPKPDLDYISTVIRADPHALENLAGGEVPPTAADALLLLFDLDEWLHVGSEVWTQPQTVEQWAKLPDLGSKSFILPNPCVPHAPARTADYILCRRYVVHEMDGVDGWVPTHEEQAAILVRLARRIPLRMVVDSGGKSLHGWFDVSSRPIDEVNAFIDLSLLLGGDKSALRPTQLVRLPQGTRKGGATQRIIYYD